MLHGKAFLPADNALFPASRFRLHTALRDRPVTLACPLPVFRSPPWIPALIHSQMRRPRRGRFEWVQKEKEGDSGELGWTPTARHARNRQRELPSVEGRPPRAGNW